MTPERLFVTLFGISLAMPFSQVSFARRVGGELRLSRKDTGGHSGVDLGVDEIFSVECLQVQPGIIEVSPIKILELGY
jgi:hypothetical protein